MWAVFIHKVSIQNQPATLEELVHMCARCCCLKCLRVFYRSQHINVLEAVPDVFQVQNWKELQPKKDKVLGMRSLMEWLDRYNVSRIPDRIRYWEEPENIEIAETLHKWLPHLANRLVSWEFNILRWLNALQLTKETIIWNDHQPFTYHYSWGCIAWWGSRTDTFITSIHHTPVSPLSLHQSGMWPHGCINMGVLRQLDGCSHSQRCYPCREGFVR